MSFSFDRPCFYENTSISDDQLGEDLTNPDWNMNIDPSLEKLSFQSGSFPQPPMSFYVQQQAQQLRAREPQQHNHQQSEHHTMQRFVDEPQRQFFTAPNLPQEFARGGLPNASIPTSSLPRASHQRMASPSFSHDLTSSSGSAASPPDEQDYYLDNGYYAMDNEQYKQYPSDLQGGPASFQTYSLPQQQSFSCVSMNQVQGFADTEAVSYENNDQGFGEVAIKGEYGVDVNRHYIQANMETSAESQGYRYPSDEGIGPSIQDEDSPKNTIYVDDSRMSDMDADGEMDDMEDMDPEHIPSTPASDTEYTPRSTRTRKSRASPTVKTLAPSTKRNRISKAVPKTKGQVKCKSCAHAPFKDAAALHSHVASAHTRAYICVFDFAGCTSTFASKNEWKRHVSSQHLNLSAWVCELGSCGNNHSKAGQSMSISNSNGTIPRGTEFNRKDLFTQHLRRMHVPAPVKRKKSGSDADWEETIKSLQKTCLQTKRQAPTQLACPVNGCNSMFEGAGCLDDRMEHVAKHLEAQAQGNIVLRQSDDRYLLNWAFQEGIIEHKASGSFRLVVGGANSRGRAPKVDRRDDEEDAEGEDE